MRLTEMPQRSTAVPYELRAQVDLRLPARATASRRATDCLIAGVGLMIATVPMALAAIAIKLSSPGPVFYRQTRIGRGGLPFCLYKLRTMAVSAGGPQVTAAADTRISPVGRVLRKMKVDELPQLWNVLRGDMAIIGPRPEVPRFVAHYTPAERQLLAVRPGLAGHATLVYPQEYAILRGRSDPEATYISYLMPAKIAADLAYEQTRTGWSDLRVMIEIGLLVIGVQLRADRNFDVPADPVRSEP